MTERRCTQHPESSLPPPNNTHHLPHSRYNLLIEFAHKHLDFQRAELESILSMHGIVLGGDHCHVLSLPNEEPTEQRHRPFLILSFPSRKGIPGISNVFEDDDDGSEQERYAASKTPSSSSSRSSSCIVSILSRCVLIRAVVELWGMGWTMEECATNVKSLCTFETNETSNGKTPNIIQRHVHKSWKMTVHTFGTRYNREEQNDMRNHFSFLPFEGPVRMDDPEEEFVLIREIEVDSKGSPLYPRHGHDKVLIEENDLRPPLAVYFGRILGGVRDQRKGQLDKFSLKRRKYLGPTSMDAELSMIMSNFAQVQKGSFCFDPFVGTGSILLTCALHDAFCFGTDIDIRVLRGKGVDETILSNFKQFNLNRPELVRSDNSLYHRHFRSHQPLFDAIICDPPYGIRAGARKCGSKCDTVRPVPEEHRHDHIAQTKPYRVSDVMADLLDVAAQTLLLKGRLVYIIPSMTDFNAIVDLPRHPCLKLVHSCYQPLQINLGRRMVTMEKIACYEESQRDVYRKAVWVNGADSAEKYVNIREKLLEAARRKPGHEEKAAIRRKKRKANKEEKKKAKLAVQAVCSEP